MYFTRLVPLIFSQFNVICLPHCSELENSKEDELQIFKSQRTIVLQPLYLINEETEGLIKPFFQFLIYLFSSINLES